MMRMFPPEMGSADDFLAWTTAPGAEDDAAVQQAIDTVARRLVVLRFTDVGNVNWEDFADIGEHDWERVEKRAGQLVKELDRGQEPFNAAYELLKKRAEGQEA